MVFHFYFFHFTCVGWNSFLCIHLYYPILYPFFIVQGSFKSKMGLCCTRASSILQISPLSPYDSPTITLLYIWSYISCSSGDPYTLCDILIPNMSHTVICDKGSQKGLGKLAPVQCLSVQIDSVILANFYKPIIKGALVEHMSREGWSWTWR